MSEVLRSRLWLCRFCRMYFGTAEMLCRHVTAPCHWSVVCHVAPETLESECRLQYFLDTYIGGEPIIGLEYVVERHADPTYLYTCLLCNLKANWQKMFIHVIGTRHVTLYIHKHYPEREPIPKDFGNHSAYMNALIKIIEGVWSTVGVTSIRLQENRVSAEVAGGGLKCCTATREDQSGSEERPAKSSLKRKKAKALQRVTKSTRRVSEIDEYLRTFKSENHYCSLCRVSCPTTMELYKHIMGIGHGSNLECMEPEQIRKFSRLQNFLDMYLKGEPILGLGYVAETEEDNVYTYTCLLCDEQEDWPQIFVHLVKVNHVACYLNRHHNELSPRPQSFCSREAYVKAVIAVAVKVHKTHGDAAMAEAASEDDGEEDDPLPSEDDGVRIEQSQLVPVLSAEDASSKNCETPQQTSLEQETKLDTITHVQELEFKKNRDFLNYLMAFEIQDEEDASIIKQITRNCTNAVKRYLETQE